MTVIYDAKKDSAGNYLLPLRVRVREFVGQLFSDQSGKPGGSDLRIPYHDENDACVHGYDYVQVEPFYPFPSLEEEDFPLITVDTGGDVFLELDSVTFPRYSKQFPINISFRTSGFVITDTKTMYVVLGKVADIMENRLTENPINIWPEAGMTTIITGQEFGASTEGKSFIGTYVLSLTARYTWVPRKA